MNNFLLGIIATLMFEILVVGVVDVVIRERGSVVPPTVQTVQTTPAPAVTKPTVKTFTLSEVAKHDSAASCYTTINGSVYDVTSFISGHPGGEEAILSLCGRDGSEAFNDQHGGDRRPASELATFKIGTLAR